MFRRTNRTPGRARRGRPSPAMAVAFTAMFMALGGVGYAAATGSIDSREIKNNTIRGKDIRTGTIRLSDINNGAEDALKGQTGPPGQQGQQGKQGLQGPSVVRSAENDDSSDPLPTCTDTSLGDCTNRLAVTVPAGSHMIQAKTEVDNAAAAAPAIINRCGIYKSVGPPNVLDEMRLTLAGNGAIGENASISLARVITTAVPLQFSLRCTEMGGENLQLVNARLTALQVGSVNP